MVSHRSLDVKRSHPGFMPGIRIHGPSAALLCSTGSAGVLSHRGDKPRDDTSRSLQARSRLKGKSSCGGDTLAVFLAGGVLGTGFGVALGFFLFPFVFPPPPAADQLSEADRRSPIVAEGRFIHANPSDPIHWGKGSVTVRQDSVFLGSDFEVGPGPKFHVYLVPKATIRASGDLSGRCSSTSAACAPSRAASATPFPPASTSQNSRASSSGASSSRC